MLRPTAIQVTPQKDYFLDIIFNNGEKRRFDVRPYIRGEWYGELGEPEEKVSLICETARRFAPDYDVDEIYAALAERGRRGAGEKQVNEPSGCVSGK